MYKKGVDPLTGGLRRTKPFWTFFITALGLAMVFLDISIVNVALQSLAAGFNIGVTDLEWVVDAYTLAFAGLLLTAGALGDRAGNKGIFLLGISVFAISSMLCGFALNFPVLIAGRVLQGVGAALIIPSSLTLLNHAYEDPHERARAFGAWGACGSTAIASGPLIGGLLIHVTGWRGIFLVNIPVGIAALCLGSAFIGKERHVTGRRIDWGGLVTSLIALTALVGALVEGPRLGWKSMPILGLVVIYLAFALAWVLIESRHADPMLPLKLFGIRQFSTICIIGLVMNVAFYGVVFTLSLYFQQVRQLTPFQTGLSFLPMSGVMILGNIISGRMAARYGGYVPVLTGTIVATFFFALAALTATDSVGLPFLIFQVAMIGVGISLVIPPLVAICLGSVEKTQIGVASGALNTSRQVGTAAGVAVLGSFLTMGGGFLWGFRAGLLLASLLSLLSAGLTFFFVRSAGPLLLDTVPVE